MNVEVYRGNQVGWGDVKFAMFGQMVLGITAIAYKRKRDKEALYGAGSEVLGVGRGNVAYEGSMKLYRYEVNRLLEGAGGKNLDDIDTFPITVVAEIVSNGGTEVYKDVVFAQFTETSRDLKQGDKMDIVELPLLIVGIDFNIV